MLLENSERFQKEYKEFSEKISKINNEKVQTETKELLNRLLAEVRDIDRKHMDMLMARSNLPMAVKESKDVLTNLRKKIQSKLQDCEKAGLLKSSK